MPVIKIKSIITNKEEKIITKTKGIIIDNTIKYQENDDTKVIFNYNNYELIRENKDYKIIYNFSKEQGNITIKEINSIINIPLKTIKITQKEQFINIEYQIEEKIFNYRIEEILWVLKKS